MLVGCPCLSLGLMKNEVCPDCIGAGSLRACPEPVEGVPLRYNSFLLPGQEAKKVRGVLESF